MTPRPTWWLCVVLAVLGAAAPAVAQLPEEPRPEPPRVAQGAPGSEEAREAANAALERGEARFAAGEFQAALAHFERAYALIGAHPRRYLILYNVAQTEERLGRPAHAIASYRRYLAEGGRDAHDRDAVEARIIALERTRTAEETGAPHEPTGPEPTEEVSPSTVSESERSGPSDRSGDGMALAPRTQSRGNESASPWPWVVGALGGAMLAGSAVTGFLVLDARNEIDEVCGDGSRCPSELESTRDRGQTLAVVTDVLWIGGAVAVAGAITWWLLEDDPEEAATVRAGCDARGCAAAVRYRF